MPLYPFLDESTGDRQDFFFSMKDAPAIGSRIRRGGQRWTRLASDAQVDADVANIVHKYPYKSIHNCRWLPGAGDYTKDGVPIITSRRNEREFMARNNLARD